MVAADEEDLKAVQVETAVGLVEEGDCRVEFNFHDRTWRSGDIRARQGGGAKVKKEISALIILG